MLASSPNSTSLKKMVSRTKIHFFNLQMLSLLSQDRVGTQAMLMHTALARIWNWFNKGTEAMAVPGFIYLAFTHIVNGYSVYKS